MVVTRIWEGRGESEAVFREGKRECLEQYFTCQWYFVLTLLQNDNPKIHNGGRPPFCKLIESIC